MNLDDFPFNDFIKELQDEKVEMKVLIQELKNYLIKKKIISNEYTELIVGIVKVCVELGYVKEDIADISISEDMEGKAIHWSAHVCVKDEHDVSVPLLEYHWIHLDSMSDPRIQHDWAREQP